MSISQNDSEARNQPQRASDIKIPRKPETLATRSSLQRALAVMNFIRSSMSAIGSVGKMKGNACINIQTLTIESKCPDSGTKTWL